MLSKYIRNCFWNKCHYNKSFTYMNYRIKRAFDFLPLEGPPYYYHSSVSTFHRLVDLFGKRWDHPISEHLEFSIHPHTVLLLHIELQCKLLLKYFDLLLGFSYITTDLKKIDLFNLEISLFITFITYVHVTICIQYCPKLQKVSTKFINIMKWDVQAIFFIQWVIVPFLFGTIHEKCGRIDNS